MSENIYDILAKFPKDISSGSKEVEPTYENVDPQDDLLESVRVLEEKYSKYSYDDEESKYLNPQAKRFVQLAKAKFPETSSDLEAVVAAIGDKTEELDQRDRDTAEWISKAKATIGQQQREIEQTEQSVTDANARYDAQEKRFQDFNRQVAAAELDVKQQAQAALDYAQQPQAQPQAVIQQVKTQQPAAEPEALPDVTVAQQPAPVQQQEPEKKSAEVIPIKPIQKTAKAGKISKDVKQNITSLWGQPANQSQVQAAAESKSYKKKMLEQQDVGSGIADTNWEIIQNNRLVPPPSTELVFGDKVLPLRPLSVQALWTYFMNKSTKNIGKPNQTTDEVMLTNLVRSTLNNPITVTYLLGTKEISGIESFLKSMQTKLRKAKQTPMDLEQPEQSGQQPQKKPAQQPQQTQQPGLASTNFGKYIQQKATEPPQQGDLFGNPNMNETINKLATSLMERFANFKEDAKPDFLDLDKDGDTDEPMKKAAKDAKEHEPAKVDKDAVAKRKRLQALKDKQEDERAEKGDDDKSSSRFVKGRAYGGSAQKDDEDKDELEEGKFKEIYTDMMDQATKKGYSSHKQFTPADYDELGKKHNISGKELAVALGHKKASQVAEVAPPGAKAERMVKGIKKSLSKDGHLSNKDKAIAYATTWKARNKGQVEEATKFGDTIKNSAGKMTKVTVKESRNAESSEYTYETIGRTLCDEQPHLDANSEAFVNAVYDELIEMKLTPKAARWLVHYDEDFLSDCATSYGHFCASKEKEMAECGAPMNSFVSEEPLLDATQELDEIARLAGLTRENFNPMVPGDSASPLTYAGCSKCNADPCCCEDENDMDEGMGCSEDELNEAVTRKDFRMIADLLKAIPDIAKRTELAMHHADIFKEQNPRFKREMFLAAAGVDTTPIKKDEVVVGEAEMGEGNEFSGALAKAKAAGEKEFEVDGKRYTVKEDININVTANGEEDVVNLIRKLSGMEAIKTVTDKISAMSGEACGACGSAPCGCESLAEEGPKERDVEYTNSPREEVAGTDAAIPSGTDLHRAKKSYSDKPFRGDNPMAVAEAKEERLWKAYEEMINDVKA
jgi:hypothetical protein